MELDRNMILCANNFEPAEKGRKEFKAQWNLDRKLIEMLNVKLTLNFSTSYS